MQIRETNSSHWAQPAFVRKAEGIWNKPVGVEKGRQTSPSHNSSEIYPQKAFHYCRSLKDLTWFFRRDVAGWRLKGSRSQAAFPSNLVCRTNAAWSFSALVGLIRRSRFRARCVVAGAVVPASAGRRLARLGLTEETGESRMSAHGMSRMLIGVVYF